MVAGRPGREVHRQWRAAGDNGMALVVTGNGDAMQVVREQAYDRNDTGGQWTDSDGDRSVQLLSA